MRGDRMLTTDPGQSESRLSRSPGNAEEYLSFLLGKEPYAINIAFVREIVKPSPICEVPRSGSNILGVMSVRGTIVTVVDLCAYTGEGRLEMQKHARVLLTEAESGEPVGLAVTLVQGVVRIAHEDIEGAYRSLDNNASPHIQGVARPEGGPMLVLLDVVSLLGTL